MRRSDLLRLFFLAALAAGCPIPGLLPQPQPAFDTKPLVKAGSSCAVCLPADPSAKSWKSESGSFFAEVPGTAIRPGAAGEGCTALLAAAPRRSEFARGERLARAPPGFASL